MSKNTIILILVSVIILVFLVILSFVQAGRVKEEATKKEEINKIISPPISAVEQVLPLPQNIDGLSFGDLPENLAVYKFSGTLTVRPGYDEILALGRTFGISTDPQSRASYGGGTTYVFTNDSGSVLSVSDSPYSLNYSELPLPDEHLLPNLVADRQKASQILDAFNTSFPPGWQIKTTKSAYLKGGNAYSLEVDKPGDANLVEISADYFYDGHMVITPNGNGSPVIFIFDRSGALISLKAKFLVNSRILAVSKVAEFKAKTIADVNKSFLNGEAKPVSVYWEKITADVPPPGSMEKVSATDLQLVLVLSEQGMSPYYLVKAKGTAETQAAGVNYLVPAVAVAQ